MGHVRAMAPKHTFWMYVALAAAILAACLVEFLATAVRPAEAAFPGQNGNIAFTCHCQTSYLELFTINANGSNQTRLTNNRGVHDGDPAFSPDGRKIAFESDRSGNFDIFTMSAAGTHVHRVTTSINNDEDPSWSPNGTKIAFASTRNGNTDIYVSNLARSSIVRLTTSRQADSAPAWSPKGRKIAFVKGCCDVRSDIAVMDAARESETNRPTVLTTSGYDPVWSPDGTKIAFVSSRKNVGSDVYVMNADGSHERRLTSLLFNEVSPTWSPDGRKLAFMSIRGRDTNWQIYVMDAAPESEANRPKWISSHPLISYLSPDWGVQPQ
jgi:Tol biopolymer transport system component